MIPRIGGRDFRVLESVLERVRASDMSHCRTAVRMPAASSSVMKVDASEEEAPEREMKIRFLAPRAVSQREMLRPRPPSPPARRYDEFGSRLICLGACWAT